MNVYDLKKAGDQCEGLVWSPELNIGYHKLTVNPLEVYDQKYFEWCGNLKGADRTTQARVNLVNKYVGPSTYVLDVGIGSGAFVSSRPYTYGSDINPAGIAWLQDRDLYARPSEGEFPVMTFWDSLEHIPEPDTILNFCKRYAFVSAPVYENAESVMKSKHYKPNEHVWYHTIDGMQTFMLYFGFELVHFNRMEEAFGRQSIGTFVFQRPQ